MKSLNVLKVGDFVGIRYYPDGQEGAVLVPHTIRITKPIRRPAEPRNRTSYVER